MEKLEYLIQMMLSTVEKLSERHSGNCDGLAICFSRVLSLKVIESY